MPKKKKIKLKKNKVYVIPNCDKKDHEYWGDKHHDMKNLLNIPGPYRCIVSGVPNCGKTTVIYNLVAHMDKPPDKIYLLHADCFDSDVYSKNNEEEDFVYDEDDPDGIVPEYKDLDYVALKTFPTLKWLNKLNSDKKDEFVNIFKRQKKEKILFIIDDISIKAFIKKNRNKAECIDKIFSFYSTHRNMTVIVSFQNINSQCVPEVRRHCNVFVFFKPLDKYLHGQLGRNSGLSTKEMKDLFKLCKDPHDSIMLDNTPGSPMSRRFNLVNAIRNEEDDDEPDLEEILSGGRNFKQLKI